MALDVKDWATECARQELKIQRLAARIRELEAESASLRADRDANIAAWERVLGKRSEGEAQTYIRELEAALQFYADPENWGNDDWGMRAVIQPPEYANAGQKARDALAGYTSDRGDDDANRPR